MSIMDGLPQAKSRRVMIRLENAASEYVEPATDLAESVSFREEGMPRRLLDHPIVSAPAPNGTLPA